MKLIVTTAGRKALINASQTGTTPVVMNAIGIGTGKYTATAGQTALTAEFKRLDIIEGGATGDSAVHVAFQDEDSDAYTVYEMGVYLADGTLFAVYSQTEPIIQKTANAVAVLAVDIAFEDIDVSALSFGDVTFSNAAATERNAGVVQIATDEEVQAGIGAQKALTPENVRALTATEDRAGLVALASTDEAKAGTDAAKAMTPATAKAAIDARAATDTEVLVGTATDKFVTPDSLLARTATTARKGLVELATESEALLGTDAEKVITPAILKAILEPLEERLAALEGGSVNG